MWCSHDQNLKRMFLTPFVIDKVLRLSWKQMGFLPSINLVMLIKWPVSVHQILWLVTAVYLSTTISEREQCGNSLFALADRHTPAAGPASFKLPHLNTDILKGVLENPASSDTFTSHHHWPCQTKRRQYYTRFWSTHCIFLCHRCQWEKKQAVNHWHGQSTFQNKKWRELASTCGLDFPSVFYSPVSTVLGTAPATLRSGSSPRRTGDTFAYFYCEQHWTESERIKGKWQRNKKKWADVKEEVNRKWERGREQETEEYFQNNTW